MPPIATAVTRPEAPTFANNVSRLSHVMLAPERVLPALSFATAVSCTVLPTIALAGFGETVTEATLAGAGGGGGGGGGLLGDDSATM